MKRKYLFLDFLLLLLLFAVGLGAIKLTYSLLYRGERFHGTLELSCEEIPQRYSTLISTGDTVYDHITKRKIGVVRNIEYIPSESGDATALLITLDCVRYPKSNSIRSTKLFLQYSECRVV